MTKKELFELSFIAYEDDKKGVHVELTCKQDGKTGDFSLLSGDNLGIAVDVLKQATGTICYLYLNTLHQEGKIDDKTYKKITGRAKEIQKEKTKQ